MGGPSVFPELPRELTKLSSKGAVWPVSPRLEDRTRRSLYVFVRRNLRYPFFEVFDRPDTNASCPRRPVTTIAPQALRCSTAASPGVGPQPGRPGQSSTGAEPNEQIKQAARIALGQATRLADGR